MRIGGADHLSPRDAASGQHQPVILKGYNAADPYLQQLTCEYRARGATDWTTLFGYLKALLPAGMAWVGRAIIDGVVRNLTAGEIVGQGLRLSRCAR